MESQDRKVDNTGNVVVLLASYNGSKYIAEQIQSILQQDYLGYITILIRDDGSSDDTVKIIKSFNCYSNREIKLLDVDSFNNIGPQRSFLKLIENAPIADYYFLSDQDDVWKSSHISSAVKMLQEKNGPALYCSNYSLSDAKLNIVKDNVLDFIPKFTPLNSFFYNKIPGCCMAWNLSLQMYLNKMHPANVMMHDRYIVSFASFLGEVIYDPQSHIFHRIHGNNVIGAGNKKIEILSWIKEKTDLLRKHELYDVTEMAREFLRVGRMATNHPNYIRDIELLRDYRKSIWNTRNLLSHSDTYNYGNRNIRCQMSIRSKIWFRLF